MAKKISLTQKITKAISGIALRCSLVIGLAGIICLAINNHQSSLIYSDNLASMNPVYHIQFDFQSINSDLKSIGLEKLTGNISGTNYEKEIKNYSAQLASWLKEYQSNISGDPQEISNFSALKTDINKYTKTAVEIEKLISDNNYTQAVDELLQSNALSNDVKEKISNAFTINSNMAANRNTTSTFVFVVAILLIICFTATFILSARKISRHVATSISEPINRMVLAAESIADGNLDVNLQIQATVETETLTESLKKIVVSLQRLKTDISMMISAALEGELDTRADSSRQKGDYRVIIDKVNQMFDTIKEPLDVASEFIHGLADGAQQQPIENIYKGYYATLIGNLNKVRDSLLILSTESDKLALAGLNGELDVRGDDTRLKGIYANIVRGVNNTFDAIKDPLDVSSNFISALADGKNPHEIENSYKGYYCELINDLNHVRNSFHYMNQETNKLITAAQNGELGVRGQTGALQGSFFDIIDGFNKALDLIVAPLSEANFVLSKMAVNDFTVQMAGAYQGTMEEFSDSIASVQKVMLSIEKIISEVGYGNLDALDQLKQIGSLSENDKITPSLISMLLTINDLIAESNLLAGAAVNGALEQRGEETKFKGDYVGIVRGMNRTMQAFAEPINEASQVLHTFSEGDLTVSMAGEYSGEYNEIKHSLNHAVETFNRLLREIHDSANQVATGSKQVSIGSQSLSQGATEQASAIEQLTSTIDEFAQQTTQNARSATQANELVMHARENAMIGNEKMTQMLNAMHAISESAAGISKIIKVIDDIAFQTNILALNAAVEAARAGQFGKGFAVVAEEVRNLAAKSADAAKSTATLIASSIEKANTGINVTNDTADVLKKIDESVCEAVKLVSNIASASSEQATAIAQIDQGLSQISNVVQTNSATAEESAASSEELSAQAAALIQLVNQFNLR